MKPKPGDTVTPRYPVPAYYSGYAGRPVCLFEPGIRGTVASIAPKVRISGAAPTHDRKPDFLVVDFVHPQHGQQRASLNFCNVEVLR